MIHETSKGLTTVQALPNARRLIESLTFSQFEALVKEGLIRQRHNTTATLNVAGFNNIELASYDFSEQDGRTVRYQLLLHCMFPCDYDPFNQPYDQPHQHRWPFVTRTLLNGLTHTFYRETNRKGATEFTRMNYPRRPPGQTSTQLTDPFQIGLEEKGTIKAGTYKSLCFNPEVIHSVSFDPNEPIITLMLTMDDFNRNSHHIYLSDRDTKRLGDAQSIRSVPLTFSRVHDLCEQTIRHLRTNL